MSAKGRKREREEKMTQKFQLNTIINTKSVGIKNLTLHYSLEYNTINLLTAEQSGTSHT